MKTFLFVSFLALVSAYMLASNTWLQPVAAAPLAQRYDLRVYGPLEVRELPADNASGVRLMRITAQDHAKASIVLSKLLSDFTTLPTVQARDVTLGAANVKALLFDGGRRILPVLRGQDRFVDVYLFDSPQPFDRFLAAPPNLSGAVKLTGRAHPFYLDRWDRHAMGFWYSLHEAPASRPELSDEADFEFFRQHDLSVNTVREFSPVAQRCRRDNLGYKINRWFDVSNYAYDAHPEDATASDPDLTALHDYYGEVPFAESPLEHAQAAEMMAALRPYTNDEHLESLTLPHGETGPGADSYQGMRDRDEPSRQDFIH